MTRPMTWMNRVPVVPRLLVTGRTRPNPLDAVAGFIRAALSEDATSRVPPELVCRISNDSHADWPATLQLNRAHRPTVILPDVGQGSVREHAIDGIA